MGEIYSSPAPIREKGGSRKSTSASVPSWILPFPGRGIISVLADIDQQVREQQPQSAESKPALQRASQNRPCSVPKKTKTPYVTPKTALKDLSCQQSTSQCLKATTSRDGYWKNAVKGRIWKQRQQSVRKSFTQGVPAVAQAHPQDVSLSAAVRL